MGVDYYPCDSCNEVYSDHDGDNGSCDTCPINHNFCGRCYFDYLETKNCPIYEDELEGNYKNYKKRYYVDMIESDQEIIKLTKNNKKVKLLLDIIKKGLVGESSNEKIEKTFNILPCMTFDKWEIHLNKESENDKKQEELVNLEKENLKE
jgi:hypothetical protein